MEIFENLKKGIGNNHNPGLPKSSSTKSIRDLIQDSTNKYHYLNVSKFVELTVIDRNHACDVKNLLYFTILCKK